MMSGGGRGRIAQWLLLCGVVAAIYWPVMPLVFVGDDYFTLYQIAFNGAWRLLRFLFTVWRDPVSYRPVGDAYFLALYHVFGLYMPGYHVCALLIHATSSLFVLVLVERLLCDRGLAWAAALVYAVSAQVHGTPLSWVTGIYDVGGAFLCLACVLLYLNRRSGASAAVYGLALLTKPATVFLPLVLLAHGVFVQHAGWRKIVRRQWLHGVVLCGYAGWFCEMLRIGESPRGPYVLSFSGISNLRFYGRALVQAVVPCPEIAWVMAAGLALFLAGAWVSGRARLPERVPPVRRGFWMVWFVAALVPPQAIPNVKSVYYLTYAWVPWIVMLLAGLRALAARCRCGGKLFAGLLAAVVVGITAANGIFFTLSSARGPKSNIEMVNSARKARLYWRALTEQIPRIPRGAVLVFEGDEKVNLYWILRDRFMAPQIWFHERTLQMCHIEDFCPVPGNIHIRQSICHIGFDMTHVIRLGETRDYILIRLEEGGARVVVTPLTLSQVYALRSASGGSGK